MAWPGQGYLELPVFFALDIHCRPDRAGQPKKLYQFLYQGGGNCCKWLIEQQKLYLSFTFFYLFRWLSL